jgi:hypothetical protein
MLRISQDPWAACKLGLQILWAQQRFLNKKNRPQLKSKHRGETGTFSNILIRFPTKTKHFLYSY